MSENEQIFLFHDEQLINLPSCLLIHQQLRSYLHEIDQENYVKLFEELCHSKQSRISGLVEKVSSGEHKVLALAFYRHHLTTFDTVRFEIHDLVVDRERRRQGLGTKLLNFLVDSAKQVGASWIVLQCDPVSFDAHGFFFRNDFSISSFGFMLNDCHTKQMISQCSVVDVTDLPEAENERYLRQAQQVFRQLRPNLPTDQAAYIERIRSICRSGPARMLVAVSNENQDDVLGVAIYRVSHNAKYSKYIYCDDLIADENRRSQGVGRALVNAMKEAATNLGLTCIALDSGYQRGRAHKFYHREGFHIDQFEMTQFFQAS